MLVLKLTYNSPQDVLQLLGLSKIFQATVLFQIGIKGSPLLFITTGIALSHSQLEGN
jgi:hypothetical protein